MENKYSDLEKRGELNLKQNEELQSQLKIKNDELEIAKKNGNFGLKFKSGNKKGEYDMEFVITSFIDLINEK